MTGRRCLDIVGAAVALVVLAPVMLATAITVRVADGRPILFRQRRSGRGGETFSVVKFRTMSARRDAAGRLLPDAQRTTRVGKALRTLRFDELPQLWNILGGDMSFVGPRPLLPDTIAEAGEMGRKRGAVRPGLTGWAQIHGNALLSAQDKIAMDCWYVEHRSLRIDLAILGRTALVVIRGERIDHDAIGRAHASGAGRRG